MRAAGGGGGGGSRPAGTTTYRLLWFSCAMYACARGGIGDRAGECRESRNARQSMRFAARSPPS